VYFLIDPFAFSTGYFFAFRAIFSCADETEVVRSGEREMVR
jgi:hypothetical protein